MTKDEFTKRVETRAAREGGAYPVGDACLSEMLERRRCIAVRFRVQSHTAQQAINMADELLVALGELDPE